MNIYSYHLVKIPLKLALKGLFIKPIDRNTKGIIHAEFMSTMTLGAPILSPSRFQSQELAIFAQWENEDELNRYLNNQSFGKILSTGWHIRLEFLRDWGKISGFELPVKVNELNTPSSPVVAVTIARMKPWAIPRFIHWGRPVEKQVRDHNGTLLSLASFGFPNTVSTFSIWRTEKEMTDMVHGHSKMPKPKRHSDAMKERERKNFHFEFSTLRFKPISEFGTWKGKSNYLSTR